MPPVGDLNRPRQGVADGAREAAGAVVGHDADLGMSPQPSLDRVRVAVGEQVGDPTPFQIAQNGPVTLAASPRPFVNAESTYGSSRSRRLTTDDAQQRVLADWHHQPLRQAGGRAATKRYAEMPDETVQARGAPSGSPSDLERQRLGEGLPRAASRQAPKAAQLQEQFDGAPVRRQIERPPLIAAVQPVGWLAAGRTRARRLRRMDENEDTICEGLDGIHDETRRQ
jgi:hypothetical protein